MKKNLKANITWLALVLIIFFLLFGLISAGIIDIYYTQILMGIGISIIMALGTNLVLGFSGQLSLGQAGFMAIGAYATAILTTQNPTYAGFYLSIIVGMIVTATVALVVGIPTLRLKGDYLAIATLGVAEIIRKLIENGGDLTNGSRGIMGILKYTTWPVVFVFVVLITIFVLNYLRSPMGREVLAVREDEIAAEAMGVHTTKIKVLTFMIAAVISSIAGSLYVGYIGTVAPKDFTIMKSIDFLIVAVLGGLGSVTGTIVAAVVLGILNMFLQNVSDIRMIIYSLALILVMVFRPGGLLGTWEFSFSKLFAKKAKEGDK